MAKSRAIPKDELSKVLLESRRRCCICFGEGTDKSVAGDIAHLVPSQSSGGNDAENLVFLCLDHHAALDRGALSIGDVKAARKRLYESLNLQEGKKSDSIQRFKQYEGRVIDLLRNETFRHVGDFFSLEREPKILGHSGLSRTIDLAIRLRALGGILVLVEIRFSTRELTVSEVEAASALFQDLGAAKGILVCNSGFRKEAITRAKSLSIGLVQIDANPEDGSPPSSDKVTYVV